MTRAWSSSCRATARSRGVTLSASGVPVPWDPGTPDTIVRCQRDGEQSRHDRRAQGPAGRTVSAATRRADHRPPPRHDRRTRRRPHGQPQALKTRARSRRNTAILGGMTSLATLAHTVPAPPPFNGLFYATVLIPQEAPPRLTVTSCRTIGPSSRAEGPNARAWAASTDRTRRACRDAAVAGRAKLDVADRAATAPAGTANLAPSAGTQSIPGRSAAEWSWPT